MGQLTAECGRVFHGQSLLSGMMQQGLIDGISSTFQTNQPTAASDKGVRVSSGNIFSPAHSVWSPYDRGTGGLFPETP